jgi:colanic acid/amylovoran biosynthesis glycosyltransferase
MVAFFKFKCALYARHYCLCGRCAPRSGVLSGHFVANTKAVTALEQIDAKTCNAAEGKTSQASPRTHRVAFLLSQFPAVSHTFLLNEVLGLRARGFDIETASINAPDRPVSDLSTTEAEAAGATHYIKSSSKWRSFLAMVATVIRHPDVLLRGLVALVGIRGLTLRQRGYWLFYLGEALLVGRWLRERGLPHLHVHFGGAVASVGMLTSIAWKIPYSLTIHGPEELLNADSYHLREKLEQVSFVFCISDFCRSQLCQITPPSLWPRFTVARLGVDPVALAPPYPPRSSSNVPIQIVCTGRLVAAKGHRTLLQAVKMLREHGMEIEATLIGNGPERSALETFVRINDLEDAVGFTSSLSHQQTLKLVRATDIFVLASFAEGIPVALMEAMAFGVPCVSTSIAGIPELIRSGIEGILVPPANVEALAEAIESLALDGSLRSFMGGSARQRIIRDYNLPLNQERLAQCFAERLAAIEESEGRR